MLKRAYISAVIAAIAAMFGFSGLLDGAAPIAKGICYVFGGVCAVSLLFSLFEDADASAPEPATQAAAPQLVVDFSQDEPALTPIHV